MSKPVVEWSEGERYLLIFLRAAFPNEGIEGEAVHRLCELYEKASAALRTEKDRD